MANQQQDSTADRLRSLYEPKKPEPKKQAPAPSAIGGAPAPAVDLDALYEQGRKEGGGQRLGANQNSGDIQDFGTNLNIGVRQIPGILTGLADIPAGLVGFDRPFDRASSAVGEAIGVDNKSAIERLRTELSPATQRSQRAVEETKGFFPSIGAYLDNPRAIVADVTASLPSTVAGGGVGGVIAKTAAKQAIKTNSGRIAGALSNRAVAAGAGEGLVAAGAQMDSISKDIDPRKAAVAAVATGLATAVISTVGAKVATKLKIGDPDLIFVGNRPTLAPGVKKRNFLVRAGMGGISEGVFQEMPQGSFEQISANWAEDKPLLEGVSEAAVGSLMSGIGMGSAAGALNVGGPTEYIPPTIESGDTTPTGSGGSPTGSGAPRGREQVTDKKLVGGIVQMAQLLDEASTPEQRKIISQHLREAQGELSKRGLDKNLVDQELSEANFEKITQRIEKNVAMAKGLAAKDVDRANAINETVDADIQSLVQIEQIHPGTRQKSMDKGFAKKFEELETLTERVRKNRDKKSRASKKTKDANLEALEVARLELEVLGDKNPELLDRFEALRAEAATETEAFDPLPLVGQTIPTTETEQIPIVPASEQPVAEATPATPSPVVAAREQVAESVAADEAAVKAEKKAQAAKKKHAKAVEAANAKKLKGKAKTAANTRAAAAAAEALEAQSVANGLRTTADELIKANNAAPTTQPTAPEPAGPKPTKSEKAQAERDVKEAKRRKATKDAEVESAVADPDQDTAADRSARARVEKLLGATQSTLGLAPEPSNRPQRVPDNRPPAAQSLAARVLEASTRRMYLKKNGQLTKQGEKDLAKFESFDLDELLLTQQENLALPKRGPLVRAQFELIQEILDTTKSSELDARIAAGPVEPLTADEMSNILIAAQNTGDSKQDLTDKQLEYFQMYNQFYTVEGRDNPITEMRIQLYRERNSQGGKLPDEKHLREQVDIAAQKIVEAIRVRRGLGSRRAAQAVLGPVFRGLATTSDPNTGYKYMSLMQAYGTGDPEQVRLAKERMRIMQELQQDIVQKAAKNGARAPAADLTAAEPTRVGAREANAALEAFADDTPALDVGDPTGEQAEQDFAFDDASGTRGGVNESAPGVAGQKGTGIGKVREMLQLMGVMDATPKQAKRLMQFGQIKANIQDDINSAQDAVNRMDDMAENFAGFHASPAFAEAGKEWNKASKKSKINKTARWAKVKNDPWVLDHWMVFLEGAAIQLERRESETDAQFTKRVGEVLLDARDNIAESYENLGGWGARNKKAMGLLKKAQAEMADTLAEETTLIQELGGQRAERQADREAAPTAPGAAPTINYRRHVRSVQPSELPPRKTTRTSAPVETPKPVKRAAPEVEPTAVLFANSPFTAGSLRAHNPDVNVAAIFADPQKAAEEDVFAILVTTDVDRFLNRVATMQAQDTGTDKADRLRALKTTGYTGATEALTSGKKLTAPTLDHRLGSVSGVDHALANVAAGSNKVHYVELVNSKQMRGINGQLTRLKSVTHRVVGAEKTMSIPAETETQKAMTPQEKRVTGPYSMDDHNRAAGGGAFQTGSIQERQSLEAAARGDNTPQQQELVDQILATDFVAPRMSITQRPVVNPTTVEQLTPEVEKYIPRGKRSAVKVVQSMVELETYLAQHNISISADAGGFTHKGKVFLIADNISTGTAGGVLMHEVGVHLSMSPRQITQLAAAIRGMKGNKIAKAALDAVDGATDTMAGFGTEVTDFDVDHEIVAYFVEEAVNAGIDPTQLGKEAGPVAKVLRNFMTMLRTSMRALGLSFKALSAQDIVDAAYGAADTVFRDPVSDPTVRQTLGAKAAMDRMYDSWLGDKPRARDYLTTMKHYTQRVGQTFLFAHDFADWATNEMPAAADFFRLVAERVTARGKFDADLQHHMNKAKDFTKAQYDQVNDYFIMSQQKEAWGFTPHEGALERNKIDRELENVFNGYTEEQQAFIKESFRMADQLQTQREAVMRNEIEQSTNDAAQREPDADKRQRIVMQGVSDLAKFDRMYRTRKVAWMPMRRHGEFAAVFISDELRAAMNEDPTSQDVRTMKGNENHYVVEFHAKPASASAATRRLQDSATLPGATRLFEREAMLSRQELIPANLVNSMRANLEADTSTSEAGKQKLLQAWTKLYIEQLGESSIRKSELERINTPGFDRDMIKNFTGYGSAIGGTIAGIQMGRETHEILHRLRSDARQPDGDSLKRSAILNEILERHAFMLDPSGTPYQDKAMGWVSLNMLLTSPAYFIINSTQPWMLTMPVLAGAFGLTQTSGRMGKNYKTIAKAWKSEHSFAPGQMTKLLSGELANLDIIKEEAGDDAAAMMTELQNLGLFDIGIAADLGSLDKSQLVITNAIAKAHRGATHAVRTVEVFNRGVTALTAFQLATAHPEKVPVGANGKRPNPQEYAIQAVLQTQGDYSGHNAPSIIKRIPFGKLMTQFRKFQLIQIGLLVRTMHQALAGAGPYEKAMGRRQLSYMLGMHVIAGGALGLPMANIAGMVYSMFGDEDEPDDLEVRLRQEIGDAGTADLLLKGLPAVWGVDVSAKVGMGTTFSVLPFTDIQMNRDSTLAAIGQLITGAAGATAAQLSDAAGQFGAGNYGNAFAGAMPRGIRDVTRAIMYKNEGLKRKNPTRDLAISPEEFSSFDIFMQGIGLPTTKTSGMHNRNRFYQNYKKLVGDRSSVIKGDYVQAYEANDHTAMQEARNEWNKLQEARVRNGFRWQSPSLLHRAVRDKRKRESTAVDGVFVDQSDRGFLDLLE